jgi:hypothetical protein
MKLLNKTVIESRSDLFARFEKLTGDFIQTKFDMNKAETKFEKTIQEHQGLMHAYTKTFKNQEEMLAEYKLKMQADFDDVLYKLSKRVSNTDMKLNMDALSDMLMLKFEQIEDLK